MELHQADCFKINMRFWKFLGIWPGDNPGRYYNYYSKIFVVTFIFAYDFLGTINFYFIPKQLDICIEEIMLYFTEIAILSKVLTFIFMRNKIINLFDMLESEMFQPNDVEGVNIVQKAKSFNMMYYKIVAVCSYISNLTNVLSPLAIYLFTSADLFFPISTYSLFPDEFIKAHTFPLYFYQSIGMHFHMLLNVNIDTFTLGLMVYVIAQLEILDLKLRRVTDVDNTDGDGKVKVDKNSEAVRKINHCIVHYGQVNEFCSLIEEVFSLALFVQFGVASCIICVCLFRFTMDATFQYYIFLGTYIFVMIIQIFVPCWLGTKIMDKSSLLAFSTYNCDWTPRSRQFKSNLRLFVERANKPLTITAGKMFSLSLTTFTSIMNSAYSFFTLLQHVQTPE